MIFLLALKALTVPPSTGAEAARLGLGAIHIAVPVRQDGNLGEFRRTAGGVRLGGIECLLPKGNEWVDRGVQRHQRIGQQAHCLVAGEADERRRTERPSCAAARH